MRKKKKRSRNEMNRRRVTCDFCGKEHYVMDGYSFAWVRLKHLQEKAAEHWLGKCVEHPTARGIVIAVYFSIGVLFHKLFPASKEARIVRVITCCFLPWRTLKE